MDGDFCVWSNEDRETIKKKFKNDILMKCIIN